MKKEIKLYRKHEYTLETTRDKFKVSEGSTEYSYSVKKEDADFMNSNFCYDYNGLNERDIQAQLEAIYEFAFDIRQEDALLKAIEEQKIEITYNVISVEEHPQDAVKYGFNLNKVETLKFECPSPLETREVKEKTYKLMKENGRVIFGSLSKDQLLQQAEIYLSQGLKLKYEENPDPRVRFAYFDENGVEYKS